jgi:glycosyltransferase involved in cell wall biosynthesis
VFETTLIITAYNNLAFLRQVLTSVSRQTVPPAQVILADDGSEPHLLDSLRSEYSELPLNAVWQQDNGFRAARARNLAILCATSQHLVLIDGDCLLPPNFIAAHRNLINPGKIVAGGRFLLSPCETNEILTLQSSSRRDPFDSFKFWEMRLGLLRDIRPSSWQTVRTCNVGLWRPDVLAVAGFDEDYVGWGLEDSDLVLRMLNSGCSVRSARFAACVSHLYHSEAIRDDLVHNTSRLERLILDGKKVLPSSSVFFDAH